MTIKVDASENRKIQSEILQILFPKREVSFGDLLKTLGNKKVCSSQVTLAKYLNLLHKEKVIEYHSNPKDRRETLYRINPLYFDRTPLYPKLMGALLAKIVFDTWNEQISTAGNDRFGKFIDTWNEQISTAGNDRFGKSIDIEKIEDVKKAKAELEKDVIEIAEKLIVEIEKSIGKLVLKSLVYQKDTDIQILESIVYFARFLYLGWLKNDPIIKSVYQKDGSLESVKKAFPISYDDLEQLFVNRMAVDIKCNKLMMKVFGTESPMAKVDDDFYEELGIPFDEVYNLKLGRDIPNKTKNKEAKNIKGSKNS